MCSTRAGAPPCSGPLIAPTAPDRQAATSAPVPAMTRAVNVDAFMPCSAADTQYASTASTCLGSGSPRQRTMNRSTTVVALSTSRCGIIGLSSPRALWATKDRAITEARARSSRASSAEMSSNGLKPQIGASMARALCTSTRTSPVWTGSGNGSAGGSPGLNSLSTSRPQTLPNETWSTSSSMSTPR